MFIFHNNKKAEKKQPEHNLLVLLPPKLRLQCVAEGERCTVFIMKLKHQVYFLSVVGPQAVAVAVQLVSVLWESYLICVVM